MKKLILSILSILSISAVIQFGSGCSTTSGASSASSSSSSINISEIYGKTTNAFAQLESAYNQFEPQIAEIQAFIQAFKKSCPRAVSSSPAPIPAKRACAVICGLTRVDPSAYNGWSGDCPGCDVDAQAFAIACQSEGVPYELLLNKQASFSSILLSAKRALLQLNPGDLLIFYISGHGGQNTINVDASETDGKNETICLFDGQLVDNKVWKLCQKAAEHGVKLWLITDTCNSGTNYRGPHNYVSALAARSGSEPNLLHWGGCADGKSSFGSAQGGTFTTALVDAYKHGQSYSDWFSGIRRRMPITQHPTSEQTGLDFQSLPAFQ